MPDDGPKTQTSGNEETTTTIPQVTNEEELKVRGKPKTQKTTQKKTTSR